MSLHPGGKHAFVANYGGGTTAVLPVLPNGQLGTATDIKKHDGVPGPRMPPAPHRAASRSAVMKNRMRIWPRRIPLVARV